jgi:hypothetical protein
VKFEVNSEQQSNEVFQEAIVDMHTRAPNLASATPLPTLGVLDFKLSFSGNIQSFPPASVVNTVLNLAIQGFGVTAI